MLMKKIYLFLLAAVLLLPVGIKAQDIILSEGFESGIPQTWTQQSVQGDVLWSAESGDNLLYPAGAYTGQGRAYLRNTTNQTLGFKTRLITPVMNLESVVEDGVARTIYQPILRFSHAQAKWTADFDTLRVYYRTNQESDRAWTLLREYTRAINGWVREEIELPQVNATYQLAFEGSENMGRGIVLDSIIVRSKPQCTTPHELELFNMVDGGVDIQWIANYDATEFQFVVMTGSALEANIDTVDIDHSSLVVYNQTKSYPFGSNWVNRVEGLEGGTTYTIYVRSICEGGENSEWASLTFNMKNVKRIPYTENFDMPLQPGKIVRLPMWTMRSNTGHFNPHINVNLSAAESRQIVRSGTSLVFTGDNNSFNTSTTGAIPENTYVYAATPELTGADLQDCQVKFYMTLGGYGCMNNYARSIIVGVMTDPLDLETFEPIDTVSQWRYATWEEHVVSLADSRSGGKFVAFVSYFDKPNKLYIEDMTIEVRPAVGMVQNVKALPAFEDNSVYYSATWDNAGVPKYNVVLASEAIDNPSEADAEKVVKTYETTTNSLKLSYPDIAANTTYFLYVQAVDGTNKGDWSNVYKLEVPCQKAIPMVFGFEPEEGETSRQNPNNLSTYTFADCVQTFSTDPEYPYTYKTTSAAYHHTAGGQGVLCLSKIAHRDAWVAFPPAVRLDTLEVEFWLRAYSTSFHARVEVGVMVDPTDLSTYEPIQAFQNNTATYQRCVASLAGYQGEGHFIVLRWVEDESKTTNDYPLIDDVEIRYLGECVMPSSFVASDITPTQATLTWKAPRMDTWDVVVSSEVLSDDNLDNDKFMNHVVAREYNLKSANYTVTDLKWGRTYYAYARSVCDREKDNDGTSLWTGPIKFAAAVPVPFPLPYLEEFEEWGSGAPDYSLPAGWTKVAAGNYPYIYSGTSYAHESSYSLYLYNYQGATTALTSRCGYAVLPKLDMDDLSKLKVSFWGRASSAQTAAEQASSVYVDTLYIGAMTDPTDSTTFTLLKGVSVPTTTITKYTVVLDTWTPQAGQYIALTTAHPWTPRATNPTTGATGTISNTIYIDDLELENLIDGKPLSYTVEGIGSDEIEVAWDGVATDPGWVIVATSEAIDPDTLAKVSGSLIVANDTIIGSTYKVTGLQPQHYYYIYLKPVNAPQTGSWSAVSAMTLCLPLTPSKSFLMDFEILPDTTASIQTTKLPDCWTGYNVNPATTSTSYIPGIYRFNKNSNVTATSYVRPNGRNSMHVYTYMPATTTATSAEQAVLATPEINVNDMASLYVSFWYKASSATYTFGFGVMKDPNDFSTYTELAMIYPKNTAWAQYEFVLGDLGYKPEMGKYVAWVADLHLDASTARYAGGYLEDIQMYEQTCKSPQVNLSAVTDTSVIVLTGLPQANKVNILLFKDTVVEALDLNDPDNGAAYLKGFIDAGKVVRQNQLSNGAGEILQGLEPNTDYTVALQMECDGGETSVWVLNTFSTLCTAKPLSYFEKITFEREMINGEEVNVYNDTTAGLSSNTYAPRPFDCWILGNKTLDEQDNKSAGYVPYVLNIGKTSRATSVVISGDASLRFYSSSSYNGAYAIMPQMDVENINDYQVTFRGRSNSGTAVTKSNFTNSTYAAGIIVGVVTDPSDLSTFMAMDTIYVQDTTVHRMIVRFTNYKGDANGNKGKMIAFMSEFPKTNVFYIDDIEVEKIESGCQIPLHLRAEPGVTTADLSWEATADNFEVYVATKRLTESERDSYKDWVATAQSTTTEVTVTGLKGATSYYAYIKSKCGEKELWSLDALPFTTNCPEYLDLPYEEDFDSYFSGGTVHPSCWVAYYNGLNLVDNPTSTIYPYVYSSAGNGSGNGLYMYLTSTYNTPEKRPTTATLPIKGKISAVMLSFEYRTAGTTANYTAHTILGVAKDVSSLDKLLETFVPVDTISSPNYAAPNNVWYKYTRELTDIPGEDMHIVLMSYHPSTTNISYHYIDNLTIEQIPTCFVPDFNVGETTRQSAQIEIVPAKDGDSAWEIMAVSLDLTDTVIVSTTKTEAVISGLKPSTSYNVYVRTDCGDGDKSNWSKEKQIDTKAYITEGAYYGFENSPRERSIRLDGATTDSYQLNPDLYSFNFSSADAPTSYSYRPYNNQNSGSVSRTRTGEGALYFYNSGTSAVSATVVLPQIAVPEDMQLRFDVRAAHSASGDSILETNYYHAAYLEIGTIEAGATNLESFQSLGTVKPSHISLGDKLDEKNNRLFDQIVFPIPKGAVDENQQIAIVMRSPYTAYIHVDNLYVEKKTQTMPTPKFASSSITPTTLTLNWENNGADKWNVYLVDGNAEINFPLDSVAEADIVQKKLGITETTVTFTGLTPGALYYAYLQVADVKGLGATSPRRYELMPLDKKIATNEVIDFEEGLIPRNPYFVGVADSAYQTLPGWYLGNTASNTRSYVADVHSMGTYYMGNSRTSSYTWVRYSHNDNSAENRDKGKSALRFYTATGYYGPYAVMPAVDCDRLDTLQMNFWARPFSGSNVQNAPKVALSTSTADKKPLKVGVVTDPNDMSTFEEIQSFYYANTGLSTTTNLFDDQDQWYQQFSLPMSDTKGKYIVFLSDTTGTWLVDDISFGHATCFKPAKPEHNTVTGKTAVLTWKSFNDAPSRVQVALGSSFSPVAIIIDSLVAAGISELKIEGLEPSTTYFWHVRTECGGDMGESVWSAVDQFQTDCPAITSGASYSFEQSEGIVVSPWNNNTSTSYMIPNCWKVGSSYTTSLSYIPYISTSTGTTWYSHASNPLSGQETNLRGLRFYNGDTYSSTTHNMAQGWAVLPEIESDVNDMELEFYILPTSFNPQTELLNTTGTSSNYYVHYLFIGTMTDPEDISTLTVLDTIRYTRDPNPSAATVANQENDYMWQKVNVSLENATGNYVVFYSNATWAQSLATVESDKYKAYLEGLTTPGSWSCYNYMWVDDVTIKKRSQCATPTDVQASDITVDGAKLTWVNAAEKSIVKVYTSAQLTESTLVVNDTVEANEYQLTDLKPFTNYYVVLSADCGDMVSNETQTYVFHTLRVPKVTENFMTNVAIPAEWTRATGRASEVFEGKEELVETTTNAWYHQTTVDGAIGAPHQYMYMYNTTTAPTATTLDSAYSTQKFGWMISPSIVLDDEHDAWLTFIAMMTKNAQTTTNQPDLNGKDDQFMVVISDDNGKTWKRENAVIWNNETGDDNGVREDLKIRNYWYGKGDYVLNELPWQLTPAREHPVQVDLSKFKGKTIKVGFYVESTLHNAINYMRVGEFNLNYYVKTQGELTNCQYNEFDADQTLGFTINEDQVGAGVQHYERIVFAPALDADLTDYDGSMLDTLYVLDANVLSAPTQVINATICEGEEYTDNNFLARTQSGVYKQKGICQETGCDSITVLNLTVNPRLYTIVEDTICEGQTYQFNGKEFTERTIINDTLSSEVTGCDSIVSLFLEVIPAVVEKREINICAAQTYYLSEKNPALNQSGHYLDTLVNEAGCRVVIDLDLTVTDTLRSTDKVSKCVGSSITYGGQTINFAGEYEIPFTTAAGCDSVVTLIVEDIPTYNDTINATICFGETYTENGFNTNVEGFHRLELTSAEGCDSIVVLNLTVFTGSDEYVDTTISVVDLPYFYGDVTYPVGTPAGVYYDTIANGGICNSTLYHKLTITGGDAVVNLVGQELVLAPSIVNRGEVVRVIGQFTARQLEGMKVEVFDMVGKRVHTVKRTENPVTIDGFNESGMYTVRIVTGENEIFIGRVVVR